MKKNLKKQNITQLLIALGIILLINYISSNKYFRLDLTSDNRYTLSDATHHILDSLNDVVYIEIYLDGEMPIGFQRMQKSITELMDEFRVIAGDNIQFTFVNPSESSDESKRNAIYQDLYQRGLDPTNVKDRDEEGGMVEKMLFPGAILSYADKENPINLLVNNPGLSAEMNLNNSIQALEYEFIDAIRKITATKRKKVAFIEGQGELDEYSTGDITRALSEYYNIDRVTIKEHLHILEPYDVVIIAGSKEKFSEKSKFIIDQYIMNGGKVLWFIEAVNISMDSLSTGNGTSFAFMNDVNLGDQLFKYGVRVNPNIIQDIQCAVIPINTAIAGQQAKFTPAPWLYFPLLNAPNSNSITKNLNLLKSEFPSSIDIVGDKSGVKKQVILYSSTGSKLLNVPLMVSLSEVKDQSDPRSFDKPLNPIAVLMEGEFESVFTNRPLKEITKGQDFTFKEKSSSTKMIVVSDADIIRNDVKQRADGVFLSPLGYDRYTQQTYGNKEFVMNAVHYLVDESGVLDIRSREFKLRILDKEKVKKDKTAWQFVNTVLPVLIILLFGFYTSYKRRKKYT
ncbi:MAG: gliding motility-associated ABC transporter substrate-binding protein GldG [Bacteroidales bacterium]|nr:gliding motility-associated ABC transporter substrate-binding protein GldG [Bacteroidales bacterium]